MTPSGPGDAVELRRGVLFALAAFGSWGLVPVFWKQLGAVPPEELLAHRVVWSTVCLTLLVAWRGRGGELLAALRTTSVSRWSVLSALFIATNWFTYIYAVATARIVEASLGYFINPLVSVLIGALVLGERLSRVQLGAVTVATAGVALLAWVTGGVPWISLLLAGSFGVYGLVRKQAPTDALLGSTLELLVLVTPAALALAWLAAQGGGALGHVDAWITTLVLATGLVTALPLLWFAEAARRLPLSTVAFFQYLSPTGQFLLGVLVYREAFGPGRLLAFVLIWAACAVFTADLVRKVRRR